MTKYISTVFIMLMVNNEFFSLVALMLIAGFFWADVAKARFNG